MECHVYFSSKKNAICAFKGPPTWIGPDFVFLGMFSFTHYTEPSHDSILEWVFPRLKLLDIPHNQKLTVSNYSSHAYWGIPPYD